MHKFVFIDLNNDGDFEDTGEAVSYGYLASTGANSAGQTVADSSTANPPAFTAPTTEGTYRIRFKVDWGSELAPCGTSKDFHKGGFMADFMLNVVAAELEISGTLGESNLPDPVVTPSEVPVYNDEVDTWYFEVYGQQEGKDAQLITTTTSWASYVVEMPFDLEGTLRVRAGVRAVAPDGVTTSDIVWTDYMEASKIMIIEGFSVDKPVIKPNETFTVSFDDERHDPATYFKILKPDGTLVEQFSDVTEFTYSIAEKGLYDVEAKYTNQRGVSVTETIRAMIQVSGPEVGALPEIKTLTADNQEKGLTNTGNVTFNLNYTGRNASGTSSRAIYLEEKGFGINASDIKSKYGKSLSAVPFTICCWFKPEQFIPATAGTNFLNIRSLSDNWPASDWGWIWSEIGNDGADYYLSFRKTSNAGTQCHTDGFNFKAGYWYHMAIVIDRNSSGHRKCTMYINGVAFPAINTATGAELGFVSDLYDWKDDNVIYIGGTSFDHSGFYGYLDEFQLWDKALSASEIKSAMWHQETISNNLIAYFDFENEPGTDNHIASTGSINGLKGFVANAWRVEKSTGVNVSNGVDKEGNSNVLKPKIGAGSPFLAGSFPITTTPSWKYTGKPTSRGTVTGNDVAGNTSVTYGVEGNYTATLTLENPWGKDTESIELVVVDGTVDLEGNVIENLNVYPNPFVEVLHIQFAKSGDYELEVLSLDGRLVQSQSVNAAAGQISRIAVNGETGAYLVRVKMQGTVVKTMKLVKK